MASVNPFLEKGSSTTCRRRSPRSPAENVVSIHIEPNIHAIVLNTSEDGLGFRALSPVTQSGALRFWFAEDGRTIEVTGELVWTDASKKTGGLRFVSLPPAARQNMLNWTT